MRESKKRPSRSSIRTLNHLHINDGVGQIQISLPPPLPHHPTPTPTPVRPEFQTIHDGRSRDTDSQHDTEASRSSRVHGSSEVRCERCYHPQRGSTCVPDQSRRPDAIVDLLGFQTLANTSPTVTSVGHSSRDSTDPPVLSFDHIPLRSCSVRCRLCRRYQGRRVYVHRWPVFPSSRTTTGRVTPFYATLP